MSAAQVARQLKNDPSRGSLPTKDISDGYGESSSDLNAKLSKLRALSDADKQLIATLQGKIDEQKKELDNRTTTISAIQRNFENLSSVAAAERKELAALRATEESRRKESEADKEELQRLHAELRRLVEKQSEASGTAASARLEG